MEQESLLGLFRRYPSLLMLCVATAIIMLGQGVTSPVLPLYARSFGVSAATVGLTIAAFGLARLFLNIPVGLASDRFGRRLVLIGGPLVVAAGSFLSATAGDIWQLLLWRFLAGAGSAMYMTGAAAYLTDIADPGNRARMMGLNQGSLLFGTSLGPAVGGLVAEFTDFRAPFIVVGGLSGLCAVWAFRSVPESHGIERRSALPEGRASRGWLRDTIALGTNLPFFLISMVTLGTFMTRTGGRQTILPLLGADRFDLSPGSLGALFTLMSFLNLAAVPFAGTLADRWGRKAVIVPASAMTCASLVMFALAGDVAFLVLASVVQGVGTGFAGPAPAAYAADIAPQASRGFAMGLYRTYGDLGFVVGPPVMGWIADASSYAGSLYFNTALVAVSAAAFGLWAPETVRGGRRVWAAEVEASKASIDIAS
ncbi:MAG TPA: MFS transporter [Dehalococcoidia bacterium]|nr:MFS transporter [Dehalococcoidia bacterium]